ncbi:MAG: 23S rRNA (adenine(2503)-C(2))-methyltransferase RlmN, partial [Kiritimatiellae bacterium]|nr:23S rRNA (adenine(2503)-C(2))-methyltransferase RlmN [Kiritimatiellia bacterium]
MAGVRNAERPESMPSLIHGLTRDECAAVCSSLGEPTYRANQLWNWLYKRRVTTWEAMTNLPATLRSALSSRYEIRPVKPMRLEGKRGTTQKVLVALRDGEAIEEVLIPVESPRSRTTEAGHARRTVCVSCQVGCRFGCAFCASGKAGFRRNLEPGEMVGQVLVAFELWGTRPT